MLLFLLLPFTQFKHIENGREQPINFHFKYSVKEQKLLTA